MISAHHHGHAPHFQFPSNNSIMTSTMATDVYSRGPSRRKRKAESQDNDRLSKRLSLLNLERNGQRLYIPVEREAIPATAEKLVKRTETAQDEPMQVDDTKHKVYIHNLDDELSSSESEADEARIVFLPDIEKHLRANRIPAAVKANPDGELAGFNLEDMQVVLYNVPSSLTVAPEKDSVRKAIIEARQRAREKQGTGGAHERDIDGQRNGQRAPATSGWAPAITSKAYEVAAEDPDAMDLS